MCMCGFVCECVCVCVCVCVCSCTCASHKCVCKLQRIKKKINESAEFFICPNGCLYLTDLQCYIKGFRPEWCISIIYHA